MDQTERRMPFIAPDVGRCSQCFNKVCFWNEEIGQDSARKLNQLEKRPTNAFWNGLEDCVTWNA